MANTKTIIIAVAVAWIIFIILPNFTLSALSIGYGVKYSDIDCDNDGIVSLSTWLIASGIVSAVYIVLITSIIIGLLYHLSQENKGVVYALTLTIVCIGLLFSIWLISWNIVGAITLFRDSMDCKDFAEPIWIMTLIALIFQWITILGLCCSNSRAKKK